MYNKSDITLVIFTVYLIEKAVLFTRKHKKIPLNVTRNSSERKHWLNILTLEISS